ncbi:MAG: ribonuclease P protein subunit [Candidatus Thermoplasmatota archaeon]|nr:ribonuclease P protein subunit [Candidatus Thermoplasmatota archaeon]
MLHKHELIGLEAEVISSTCSNLVGFRGTVVDETKNTVVIDVKDVEKTVPKQGTLFRFHIDGGVDIDGARLLHRPEDRTKRAR